MGSPKKNSGSPKSGDKKGSKGSDKKGSKGSDKKNSPKKGSDKNSKEPVELTEEEIRKIPITHVIFNLDGTLIDSVRAFDYFVNELLIPYEKCIPLQLLEKIQNRKLEKVAKMIVRDMKLPITYMQFIDEYNKRYPEILQSFEMLPDSWKAVDYFYRHKMPMAVVTDSTEEMFQHKIARHKLHFQKFSHFVCYSSDEDRGKPRPDPHIYKLAASKFPEDSCPSSSYNVLVFEHTWKGVDAALAANMRCVWLPDSRLDVSQHNYHRDLMVIDSFEHFKPELWNLPYYNTLYCLCDRKIIYGEEQTDENAKDAKKKDSPKKDSKKKDSPKKDSSKKSSPKKKK